MYDELKTDAILIYYQCIVAFHLSRVQSSFKLKINSSNFKKND